MMRNWLDLLPNNGVDAIEVYLMWERSEQFHDMVEDLDRLVDESHLEFDLVATIASTGIVFASPIAFSHGKGLIVLRKEPKIRHELMLQRQFLNWHNEPEVIYLDALMLSSSKKVLIIDDIIQTKNSVLATIDLLSESGNASIGCFVVANLSKADTIGGIPIRSVIDFPKDA
jgi:adenine/guanine phosphoribosyltransferase-like PRPP-binding protein